MWLIGLALGLTNGSWAAALIAGIAALVAIGYGVRTLSRFAGAAGVGRLILVLLVIGAVWGVFRLLLVPSDNPILAHGHDTAAPLLGLIGAFPSAAGAEPIPSQPTTNNPVAPPGANATRFGAAAALTRQAAPLAPAGEPSEGSSPGATPELQPESTKELAVGRRARVTTAGNRLNGRSEPGMAGAIVAAFENGQLLDVIEGPVSADGYRWWRLRGEAGEGWSADEFLVAIE